MAFEPDNKSIKQALKSSELNRSNIKQNIVVPMKNKVEQETTKNYTFTLKPSIREQLRRLSKQHGYNSDSKFLSDLITNIKD